VIGRFTHKREARVKICIGWVIGAARGDWEAAHPLSKRAAKRSRKKRTRPEPRQYTVADLERARDRVAAAERRIDNDRTSNPNRGRAGLERAQLELSVIESQLRLRGLLE
jgi:hypothetical protein